MQLKQYAFKLPFVQIRIVRDVLAYLRLIVFDEDASFKRIISKPRRRFGDAKMEHLVKLQSGKSLYQTLKENIDDPKFKNTKAKEFVAMVENVRAILEDISVYKCVEMVLSESEYETGNEGAVTLRDLLNHIALQSADD